MSKKILFINQEIKPYVPDTEVSVMGVEFPQKMQESGYEIRTFMPKWGNINERRGQLHEVIRLSGMNIAVDNVDHPLLIKVASIPVSRIQVYFIDNEDFFNKRLMLADKNGKEYTDNGERAIFFARGVLETVMKLRWVPDYIVCQGWMSAVVPFYLKTVYAEEPSFANAKVVSSFFGVDMQNSFGENLKKCLPFREATAEMLEKYKDDFDIAELSKLAIDHSDAFIVGSSKVSPEVIDYAEATGRPLLKYSGEGAANGYKAFIDSLD